MTWHKALWKIVDDIYAEVGCEQTSRSNLDDYDESDAAIFFEKDLDYIFDKIVFSGPITLMFDEIEDITPYLIKRESDEHNKNRLWADGSGFIHFWNTIKARLFSSI